MRKSNLKDILLLQKKVLRIICLKSPTDCFKLLRSLGFSQSYTSVLYFDNQVYYTDSEKVTCFNNYFGSAFRPKTINPSALLQSSDHKICLDDVFIQGKLLFLCLVNAMIRHLWVQVSFPPSFYIDVLRSSTPLLLNFSTSFHII